MELTQARVRELFEYRESGALVWRSGKWPGREAGYRSKNGYTQVRVSGRLEYLHRLIFLWHHGWLPDQVDHRDGDRTNCRICNLRPATVQQNNCNRVALPGTASGRKGVAWSVPAGRWRAYITVNRRQRHLGYFDTVEAAAAAYAAAAPVFHGEFART